MNARLIWCKSALRSADTSQRARHLPLRVCALGFEVGVWGLDLNLKGLRLRVQG